MKELVGGIAYRMKENALTEGTLPQGGPVSGRQGEIKEDPM
ncbi:hypothetical protein [Corallococcus exiguus]|nr:hypothetical protein [Corallococcus exiguus]